MAVSREAAKLRVHSQRAWFGDKDIMNDLHGSATGDAAARKQAVLFPNFELPREDGEEQQKRENMQWTLAILKPELFVTKKSAVLEKISQLGFKIIMCKETWMDDIQAAKFFKENKIEAYFSFLVNPMSGGFYLALTLAKDDAIKAWKEALGPPNIYEAMEIAPQSLRAQFPGKYVMNQLHGSDNEESAKAEIAYFFPVEQTLAVIKPHAMEFKDEIIASIKRAGFKIAASKETKLSRKDAEILYEDEENNRFYEDLINSMTSGPALFMALSKQGAHSCWSLEMGDVNPKVAKATNPDSLRARFGISVVENAVHGSTSKRMMYRILGCLQFNEDGTVIANEMLSRRDQECARFWNMTDEQAYDFFMTRFRERSHERHLKMGFGFLLIVLLLFAHFQITYAHCQMPNRSQIGMFPLC
ncbi:hypothetical protein BsWGS_25084 [Bradybaena similaris]